MFIPITISSQATISGYIYYNSTCGNLTSVRSSFAKPPYNPLLTSPGNAIEFYGDSVTSGVGLTPTSLRYSSLLASQYGFTENNYAIGGDMIFDVVVRMFPVHVPGVTSFLNIGFNDITDNTGSGAPKTWSILRSCFQAILLTLLLPSYSWATSATQSGTWGAASYNGHSVNALYSNTPGSTLSFTTTGRYVIINVCFTTNTVNYLQVSYTPASGGATVSTIYGPITPTPYASQNSGSDNAIFYSEIIFYDTGIVGANTNVVFTIGSSDTATIVLNYYTGFDNLNNSASVFVLTQDDYDFPPGAGGTYGSYLNQVLMRDIERRAVLKFRQDFGANVYYVEASTDFILGMKQADQVHPNPRGHIYIKDRINSVILNGEYPL